MVAVLTEADSVVSSIPTSPQCVHLLADLLDVLSLSWLCPQVTPPGYGVSGSRALPCPKGEFNAQDSYSACSACSSPLTTAGAGAGVTAADCGVPSGYGYDGASVVPCAVGECLIDQSLVCVARVGDRVRPDL